MVKDFRRIGGQPPLWYTLDRWLIRSGRQGSDAVVVARGFHLDREFLVLRGSEAFVETAPALDANLDREKAVREARAELVEHGTWRQEGDVYVFERDVVFNSPSLAASVILGRSADGLIEWQDVNRISMKPRDR